MNATPSDDVDTLTGALAEAARVYADVTGQLETLAEQLIRAKALRDFPDLSALKVVGEWNVDMNVRITVTMPEDVDPETFDAFVEDTFEQFVWLGELDPEGWFGHHEIDLTQEARES